MRPPRGADAGRPWPAGTRTGCCRAAARRACARLVRAGRRCRPDGARGGAADPRPPCPPGRGPAAAGRPGAVRKGSPETGRPGQARQVRQVRGRGPRRLPEPPGSRGQREPAGLPARARAQAQPKRGPASVRRARVGPRASPGSLRRRAGQLPPSHGADGRRAPQSSTMQTARTPPCRSGSAEVPCFRIRALSRARRRGPWPLLSFRSARARRTTSSVCCSFRGTHRVVMSASPLSGCARHSGERAGISVSRRTAIGSIGRHREAVQQFRDLAGVHRATQRATDGPAPHGQSATARMDVAAAAGHHLARVGDHRPPRRVPDQADECGLACRAAAADAGSDGHGR